MTSVWYTGASDSRRITEQDWLDNEIAAPTVVWDESNGYSIPTTEFTEDQLGVIEAQGGFDTAAPDGPRDSGWVPPPSPPEYVPKNVVFDNNGRFLEAKLPPRLSPEGLNNTVATEAAPPVRRLDALQERRNFAPARISGASSATLPDGTVVTFVQASATELTGTVVKVNGNNDGARMDSAPGGPYQQANYSPFRFTLSGPGAPINLAGGSFVGARPRSTAGGDVYGIYAVDYMIDSADHECLWQFVQSGPGAGQGYVRLWLDGRVVLHWSKAPYAADQYWKMRITPPKRRQTHVRAETNMGVRQIYIDEADAVWKPTMPLYSEKWVLVGDSWSAGAQDPTCRGFHGPLAELLGVNLLRVAHSATGYTTNGGGANGKMTFPQHIVPDVVPHSPARVLFVGSINDAAGLAGLQAAAEDAYNQVNTLLPDARILVVGPQYGTYGGPSAATCAAMDAALQAALANADNVDGFVSTAGWITGNGKFGAPSTTTPKGNSERLLADDGIHLGTDPDSHEWFANRLYVPIQALVADSPILA